MIVQIRSSAKSNTMEWNVLQSYRMQHSEKMSSSDSSDFDAKCLEMKMCRKNEEPVKVKM